MLNPGVNPSLISPNSTPSSITSSPNHPTRTPNYSSNHTPNHPKSHIASSLNSSGHLNHSTEHLNYSTEHLNYSIAQLNHSISGHINHLTKQTNHSIAGQASQSTGHINHSTGHINHSNCITGQVNQSTGQINHSITVQIHHQIAAGQPSSSPNSAGQQLHHSATNSTKLQINHSTELLNQIQHTNHSTRQLNQPTDLLNQHLNQHLHHSTELINHSKAQHHHLPVAQHNQYSTVAHINNTIAHLNTVNHSNGPLNHSNNPLNHSNNPLNHSNHAIVAQTPSSSTPRHHPHQVLYPLPKLASTNSSISSNSNSTISFSSSNVSYRTLDPHSDAADSSPRSVIRHIHSSAAPSPDCRSRPSSDSCPSSGCPPDPSMAPNSANSPSSNLNSPSPKPWSPAESVMKHQHHHHHVQELQYPRSPSMLSDKKANNCVDSDARRSSSSSSRKGLSSIDSWKHGSSSRSSFSDQSVSQGSDIQAKKNDSAFNNNQPKKWNNDHMQKPMSTAANYLIQNASMQKGMQFRSLNYPPKAMSDVVSVDDDRGSVASRQSRAPRSPESTLLGQHHHHQHQHHQRMINCSKWEDAEKWLSQGAGCRGFANNPLRMLGGGRSSAWSSNNGSLQGSPANHSHHVPSSKPLHTPTQAVSIDCFNAAKAASNKYTQLDQQQHQQFQHPSPQTIKNPKSHDQMLPMRSPNVHHSGESKPQSNTNILALKPQVQSPHVHHNVETNINHLPVATTEASIPFDRHRVNAWIPPPSDVQAQRTLRPDPTDRLTNREPCTLGNIGMSNAMNRAYPIKEAIVISTTLREVGTQITSIDGSNSTSRYPSKCGSPQKEISPARHNTPARLRLVHHHPSIGNGGIGYVGKQLLDLDELAHCHRAKLELQALSEGDRMQSFQRSISNWSSRETEEADLSRSLRHSMDLVDHNQAPQVVQTVGSPRNITKLAKLKRKEAQIQAWEAQRKEKANAELKKLEEKLEKQRSQMTNKIMNKLLAAQKQAEEKRSIIRFEQSKASLEARRARHRSLSPTPRCACFS